MLRESARSASRRTISGMSASAKSGRQSRSEWLFVVLIGVTLSAVLLVVTALRLNSGPASPLRAAPLATGSQDVTVYFPLITRAELPLRAAFYYPWYPEAWEQGGVSPYTNYTPTLGFYDSTDPAVIQQHIAAMQYGNIQAGIVSLGGQGNPSHGRLPANSTAPVGNGFRSGVFY